jgi:hypothetical protein
VTTAPDADLLDGNWRDIRELLEPTVDTPDYTAELAALRTEIDNLRQQTPEPPAPAPLPAQPEPEAAPESKSLIDRGGPWVALLATIGLTASGEYQLALLIGWARSIAWLLPTAIDVYVTVALRRHRDLIPALGLMFTANAVYHLAAQRLVGTAADGRPEWWLVVGVAAIAPYVMWRVHQLTAATPQRHVAAPTETPTETVPAKDSATAETAPETAAARPPEMVPAIIAGSVSVPPAATPETGAGLRETAPVKRSQRPVKRHAAKPAATAPTPSQLRPREEQLEIVAKIVAAYDGDDDPPLETLAAALGASKSTASRRLGEYKKLPA